MKQNIVAVGGGATSEAILRFIFELSGKKNPEVLIVNTATGDSPEYLMWTYSRFAALGSRAKHLTFFARTPPDLEALVMKQDIIFIGGGNTKSMLPVWREYGFDKLLHKAWQHGIVLAGSSAGGICWFEGCCTDSYDLSYTALPALGFLKGSCCPHYDGEAGRQEQYRGLIKSGQLTDGFAIDEGVGLHFVGDELKEIVTARGEATAYTVALNNKEIEEKTLEARLLT